MGAIPQLYPLVNTREAVYHKKLIPPCVNYTSERADYKIIFAEGSTLCVHVCVRARVYVCGQGQGPAPRVNVGYLYYNYRGLALIVSSFCLIVFSDFSQMNRDCFTILNYDQGSTKEYSCSGNS